MIYATESLGNRLDYVPADEEFQHLVQSSLISFRKTADNMNFRPLPMRFFRLPWHHHVESQIRHAPLVMRDQSNQQDWKPSPMPKRRLNIQSRDYSSARSRAVPLRMASKVEFWSVGSVWKRASVNTLRCLVGCTTGDFSTLWYLQAYHPGFGMGATMALSSRFNPNPSSSD